MGKAGKARKRQRLERELLNGAKRKKEEQEQQPVDESDEDGAGSEDEKDTEQVKDAGGSGGNGLDEEKVAITVLDLLGRRLDIWPSKKIKALRTALFPLISGQHKRRAFFEPPDWPADCPPPDDAEAARVLTPAALATVTRVANRVLAAGPDAFTCADTKPFRRALHPLVVEFSRKEGGRGGAPIVDVEHRSLSACISAAFRRRDWTQALTLLTTMQQGMSAGERPRLGALQRWVRDCDVAAATQDGDQGQEERERAKNMSLLLLDAVLRVAALEAPPSPEPPTPADPSPSPITPSATDSASASSAATDSSLPALPSIATVSRHPPYRPPLPPSSSSSSPAPLELDTSSLGLHVVSHVPAAQRRPPSDHDLNIYATAPGAILPLFPPSPSNGDAPTTATSGSSDADAGDGPQPTRYDIPGVPGAFLLADVLSPAECRRIIQAAEHIGYAADAVLGIDCVQWLADPSLLDPIYTRCQPLLPPSIGGGALCGVNARWRLFRYTPGAVYRPHIDGAWPGSGFDADGKYTDDAYKGTRVSRLTFLVYLNGGFQGGGTTFFLPGPQGPGHIDARCVEPREGSILCFPHGDAQGSLVHEGSAVAEGGVKYVIRSDVLYATKPEGTHSGDPGGW